MNNCSLTQTPRWTSYHPNQAATAICILHSQSTLDWAHNSEKNDLTPPPNRLCDTVSDSILGQPHWSFRLRSHIPPSHQTFTQPPPSSSSKITVRMFAAIIGNFKYCTACSKPIACTRRGLSDGSHPMLFTPSSPCLAKNRFRLSIRTELVKSSPA